MKISIKNIIFMGFLAVMSLVFYSKVQAAGPSDSIGDPYGYSGCGYYGCSYGNITFSQSNVNLYAGQSQNVTIYGSGNYGGYYGNSYYVSSNSNSSAISASISGNSLSLYGLVSGSSTVTVCQSGYSSACGSVYVTVSGGSQGGTITFSQSSVSMSAGQSQSVSIYGNGYYSGSYYVSNNSNSSVVSASINGNTLNLYGLTAGSATITVCQNSYGQQCGSVYVTISGNGGVGGLSFNPSSVNLAAGQSQYVTISSGVNMSAYPPYISSNSNSNVASASISGSQLYIVANNSGSTTLTVCLSGGSTCGSVYVTVGGSGHGGQIGLSQTSLSLNAGQNQMVSIYNNLSSFSGNSYYVSNNSNSSVASATVSGSTLNVYGLSSGNTTITVCTSGYNYCAYLYVTVSGSTSLSFSQNNISLNYAQGQYISIYNTGYNSGNYYISSNSNSSAVSASISGSQVYLYGQNTGYSTITVCQYSGSACGSIYVTVGSGSGYGSISLSQTSLNLNPAQTGSVNIYGNGGYYVSSNSNPSVAGVSLSGNTLNISAYTQGSTNIVICQSTNACATLYITVGSGYGYGTVGLSQTSVTINKGQSVAVTISGGYSSNNYYVSANTNAAVASATITGNTLNLYGNAAGYTTVTVCQTNTTVCASANVTVTAGGVLGYSAYANGTLINENGTIYIIYKNSKTGFANAAAFLGLGYSFANVTNVGTANIPYSGYTVSSANVSHPWGSWIRSGNTVYFVHELGLIPVPDWNTFLSNGGNSSLLVPANNYDFARSILSVMVMNDIRLK